NALPMPAARVRRGIGLPGACWTLAHRVGSARPQASGFVRLTVAGGTACARPSASRSLGHAPRRALMPCLECCRAPAAGLVLVTSVARVGDAEQLGLCRSDELESVGADIHVADRLLDLRHVTGDALASGTARLVVSVGFEGGRARAVG